MTTARVLVLAFLFDSPSAALATAIGAAAVPVLIHLINRKRFRVVRWAAMRFVLEAERESLRRIRVQQILLLVVRSSVLIALALAMASAMPWADDLVWRRFFPDRAPVVSATSRRTHRILVLDGSFSMAAKAAGRSCFERAQAAAIRVLEESPAGDGFNVLLMAQSPRRVVPRASDDARAVEREIEALRLPHGNADVLASLNAIDDMLRHSADRFDSKEVYFFTDLGRSTWTSSALTDRASALQKIQAQARVVFVDTGQEGLDNVAVTSVVATDPPAIVARPVNIAAELHNYGTQPRRQLRVELHVGRGRSVASDPDFALRLVQEQTIDLAPGETATAVFSHRFDAPGEYAVQVRSESDSLELDDVRTAILSVRDSVPVLLVNGKPAAERDEQATEWIRDALNPFPTGTVSEFLGIQPRTLSDTSFADAGLAELTNADCVFLCDVPRLGRSAVRRLETYLGQGGGVVLCLGPDVDLEAYNQLLYRNGEGFLPARLLGYRDSAGSSFFSFQADDDAYHHALLTAFSADRDRSSLTNVRFHKYVRAALPAHSQGRPILSFAPWSLAGTQSLTPSSPAGPPAPPGTASRNDPAVVVAPFGKGRVILITSTADMDWGTWPASPSFPAFVQESLRFAIAGRLGARSVSAGQPLEETLPPGTGSLEATVHVPDKRSEMTQVLDGTDVGTLRWTDTDATGIYRVVIGKDSRDHLFAVNVPMASEDQRGCESDLIRATREELHEAFPGAEFELTDDPEQILRADAISLPPSRDGSLAGQGVKVARLLLVVTVALSLLELLLAWRFGRVGSPSNAPFNRSPVLAISMAAGTAILVAAAAIVMAIDGATGDFLAALPEPIRQWVQRYKVLSGSTLGESIHCRLAYLPWSFKFNGPWFAAAVLLAATVLVVTIYRAERSRPRRACLWSFVVLRLAFVLLAVGVLLPQLRLLFERQSLPDVALIIDDSRSMSVTERRAEPGSSPAVNGSPVHSSANRDRLQLAKSLLTESQPGWIESLLQQRRFKVHLYRSSADVGAIGEVADSSQLASAISAVRDLRPEGQSSRLGVAIHQVLDEFRGGSLASIIMLTDGVNTDGEGLEQAASYAAQLRVPVFFVGLGDTHEPRELRLHDLQVEDSVYTNDKLIFEARLSALGFRDVSVPVVLREKGAEAVLATQMVKLGPQGNSMRIRLAHRPVAAGEKTYILEVPRQPGQTNPPEESRLERTVFVQESKTSKVLYVEGYARYEYRYLKNLLEREGGGEPGVKAQNLRVLLLDADEEYPGIDRSAIAEFPTKAELDKYDVIIIGDVDPQDRRVVDHWSDVCTFVRERGGGVLFISGERYTPQAFKDTPLQSILPVVPRPVTAGDNEPTSEFRLEPTIAGRLHSLLRFDPDEAQNLAIWKRLPPMPWCARSYDAKPGAEILAIHPLINVGQPSDPGAAERRHPLIVRHFAGAGRVLFFGFDQTWRWRFREYEPFFNQFWLQTMRFLARAHSHRLELVLDRQTPYRRGDPIRLTVRFPEDAPVPATEVKVTVERKTPRPDGSEDTESQTLVLKRVTGSRGAYESVLSPTPEGSYRFHMNSPAGMVGGAHVECLVLPPPGEMDRLVMDRAAMERAAEISRGRFYTLEDSASLLGDLPAGARVTLNATRPPFLLWNHPAVFLFALWVLGAEWFLRRRMHLL